VIAEIYMGTITRWNDPAIVKLNRGMPLPAQHIRAFNSAEPGGSGFVFDQWLALTDPTWSKAVGVSLQPAWPTNGSIGQPSSGSMVQAILSTPYSLGFVGFDYAISNHLQAAALQNAAGVFLTPSLNGLSYAINKALALGMPADFRRSFVNVADRNAFNPACFEFYVVHKNLAAKYSDVPLRQAIKAFLEWAVDSNKGQQFIEEIEYRKIGRGSQEELAHGFIPVPEILRGAIKAQVDAIQD
jgi:phosphate transport system substrate-binding protein